MFLISSKAKAAKNPAIPGSAHPGAAPAGPGEAADEFWKSALLEGRIADPVRFSQFMLGKVSRTFALNIQVLPAGLRRQVLLAYLFCRMADTLEDDADLPADEKMDLLESFRALFPPGPEAEHRLEDFTRRLPPQWGSSGRWDHLLVFHCRWIYPQLREFSGPVIRVISDCVREMGGGMSSFTARFRGGSTLIRTLQDLDEYCYYVAGTVGLMLCELFALHSPLIGKQRAQALKDLSVSFGLGLQLTNILKDIGEDGERNVSFIPPALVESGMVTPGGFLQLIRKAKSHLEDALEYSCLLPRLEPRLRLFCLWPLFMAAETLVLLARGGPARTGIKISRAQVRKIVSRTSLACWTNSGIRLLFRKPMNELESLLSPAGAAP